MENSRAKLFVSMAFSALAVIIVSAPIIEAQAATSEEIKNIVVEEANAIGIPPALALAVAKVESNFDDDAKSSAGAIGVMQIMPRTAMGEYGVHREELFRPRVNVQVGVDYLAKLYDRYGTWTDALKHYHGGSLAPRNMRDFPKTRAYVTRVMEQHAKYVDEAELWGGAEAAVTSGVKRNIVVKEVPRDERQWHRPGEWQREDAADIGAEHPNSMDEKVKRARDRLDDF